MNPVKDAACNLNGEKSNVLKDTENGLKECLTGVNAGYSTSKGEVKEKGTTHTNNTVSSNNNDWERNRCFG